jgi:prepilin-type processing-associated H-X9-DG protein
MEARPKEWKGRLYFVRMYAVADARPFRLFKQAGGFHGSDHGSVETFFGIGGITEANPPHAQGYNMLFADAHVDLEKRKDYLHPPRSAHNWNRDNQPHPEPWSAASEWAVQN